MERIKNILSFLTESCVPQAEQNSTEEFDRLETDEWGVVCTVRNARFGGTVKRWSGQRDGGGPLGPSCCCWWVTSSRLDWGLLPSSLRTSSPKPAFPSFAKHAARQKLQRVAEIRWKVEPQTGYGTRLSRSKFGLFFFLSFSLLIPGLLWGLGENTHWNLSCEMYHIRRP